MTQMRRWLMLLAVVVLWAGWGGLTAASAAVPSPAAALDSYCGDGVCDTGYCGEWQTPGDGCEEDSGGVFQFCWDDCGYCGDEVCTEDEVDSCTDDCGDQASYEPTCGDSICAAGEGEDYVSCPDDCPRYNDCGDGICDGDPGETIDNCPEDCTYTSFCWYDSECSIYGSWEHCRDHRCTYDPLADTCEDSLDCGPGSRCYLATGASQGICVPLF